MSGPSENWGFGLCHEVLLVSYLERSAPDHTADLAGTVSRPQERDRDKRVTVTFYQLIYGLDLDEDLASILLNSAL